MNSPWSSRITDSLESGLLGLMIGFWLLCFRPSSNETTSLSSCWRSRSQKWVLAWLGDLVREEGKTVEVFDLEKGQWYLLEMVNGSV